MRKTLDELENLVLSPLASMYSNVFHEITDILLVDYLDFRKVLERYQVDPFKLPVYETITVRNMEEVKTVHNKLLSQGTVPQNYARRLTYERNNDNVVTFSHHKTLDNLLKNKLVARSIMSTTNFNLGKRIVRSKYLRTLFGDKAKQKRKDPLGIAFEEDYIVLHPRGLYGLHPKHLYEAAKKV
jgi:uncharacterized protein YbcC (UPF0753/DUF2309 family)